jgi:hypothetical protein
MQALRKRARGDKTEFTTKIGGKTSLELPHFEGIIESRN